jgi:hypothetical protein
MIFFPKLQQAWSHRGKFKMAVGIGRRKFVAVLGSAASFAWPLAARGESNTTVRLALWLCAAMLAVSTIACSAGPCSPEIGRMQRRLDARLAAKAETAPQAAQGTRALLHRQPTPGSMAAAEVEVGVISPEKAKAVREAMARARDADQAGDKATCEKALAEVQRTIGP